MVHTTKVVAEPLAEALKLAILFALQDISLPIVEISVLGPALRALVFLAQANIQHLAATSRAHHVEQAST